MRRRRLRTRFRAALTVVLLALGLCVVSACGADITPRELDEPCTRTSQCETGLVCLTGVCQVDPDGGTGGAGGEG